MLTTSLILLAILACISLYYYRKSHRLDDRAKFYETKFAEADGDREKLADAYKEAGCGDPYDYTIRENFYTSHFSVWAAKETLLGQKDVLVKVFPYDIKDEGDRSYALRCAEELVEKLNEQI